MDFQAQTSDYILHSADISHHEEVSIGLVLSLTGLRNKFLSALRNKKMDCGALYDLIENYSF